MHAKIAAFLVSGSLLLAGCSRGAASSKAAASTTVPPIAAVTAPVENRVLPRILEVTGALAADESADIASDATPGGDRASSAGPKSRRA